MDKVVPPDRRQGFTLWRNIEEFPSNPDDYSLWLERASDDPGVRSWIRFRPHARYDDPLADLGRVLIALDVYPFIGVAQGFRPDEMTHMAPTLALNVTFHDVVPESDWLYVEATCPVVLGGVLEGAATVWAEDGRPVASGRQTLLCRPWSMANYWDDEPS
jgi:acyl-CoA thioesterase